MKKALLISATALSLFIFGTAKSHAQCYGGGYYGGGGCGYNNRYGMWGNGQGATLNGIAAIVAAAAPILAAQPVAVPPPVAAPPCYGGYYPAPPAWGNGWNGCRAPIVPTYRAGYGVAPY